MWNISTGLIELLLWFCIVLFCFELIFTLFFAYGKLEVSSVSSLILQNGNIFKNILFSPKQMICLKQIFYYEGTISVHSVQTEENPWETWIRAQEYLGVIAASGTYIGGQTGSGRSHPTDGDVTLISYSSMNTYLPLSPGKQALASSLVLVNLAVNDVSARLGREITQ